jgi:SagB-type dehydrogenase family enzyme
MIMSNVRFHLSYNESGKEILLVINDPNSPPILISPSVMDGILSNFNGASPESKEAVLRILRDRGVMDQNNRIRKPEENNLWNRYEWSDAYSFHKASQRTNFYDNGKLYSERQDEIQDQILTNNTIPMPADVDENSTLLVRNDAIVGKMVGETLLSRKCSERPVSNLTGLEELSNSLWLGCQSFRDKWRPDLKNYSVFDSYGTSFDFYLVNFSVNGLPLGVYTYVVDKHALNTHHRSLDRRELHDALIGHDAPLSCAFTLFIVGNYERSMFRYKHERALRNLYVESGRICQNLILSFTRLGYTTHITPASKDSKLIDLLALEKHKQSSLYAISCG